MNTPINDDLYYADGQEIRVRERGVWALELPEGKRKILVMSPDMSFLEVHQYCQLYFKEFELSQFDVGEVSYFLEKGDQIYRSDSRAYNQDLKFVRSRPYQAKPSETHSKEKMDEVRDSLGRVLLKLQTGEPVTSESIHFRLLTDALAKLNP